MSGAQGQTKLDELIAESRRIQDALMRVVIKLDVFADQLTEEAAKLHQATGENDERISQGEAPSVPPGGGRADQEGGGADGGGGG